MSIKGALTTILIGTALSAPLPASAAGLWQDDAIERLQRMPRLPKVPKLPSVPKPAVERSTSPVRGADERSGPPNRELQREYSRDVDMLAYQINTSWSSKDDNIRIETAVAEYRERVDRVAGARFTSLAADVRAAENAGLRAHYDTVADTIDREVAWIEQGITDIGVADASYNQALVLDAALYGAVTLFPDNADYAAAKAKSGALMEKFGSRAGAGAAKDEAIMAKARLVQMPAPTERNRAVESQFRTAWGTSGIPYTIQRIHIRGGWGVKRNEFGRVIGRTRDAAIAVKDSATGHCYLYDFTMLAENGGGVRRSSHAAKRMACENIPK